MHWITAARLSRIYGTGGIAELEAAAARQPEIVAPYDEEHMKYIKKAED